MTTCSLRPTTLLCVRSSYGYTVILGCTYGDLIIPVLGGTCTARANSHNPGLVVSGINLRRSYKIFNANLSNAKHVNKDNSGE